MRVIDMSTNDAGLIFDSKFHHGAGNSERIAKCTPDQLEERILCLDNNDHTLVRLRIGRHWFGIDGGRDDIVSVHCTSYAEDKSHEKYVMINPEIPRDGRWMAISVDGRWTDQMLCCGVPRAWAVKAARYFYDTQALDPEFAWERMGLEVQVPKIPGSYDTYGFLEENLDRLVERLAGVLGLTWTLHDETDVFTYYGRHYTAGLEGPEGFLLAYNFVEPRVDLLLPILEREDMTCVLFVFHTARPVEIEHLILEGVEGARLFSREQH